MNFSNLASPVVLSATGVRNLNWLLILLLVAAVATWGLAIMGLGRVTGWF